jgi:hypothetical protein
MASGVGGTISLNYYSVQGLNLESRAQFATEEDRQVFLDAIKNARAQEAEGNFNSTLEFPMPLNAEALGLLPGKLTAAGEVFADTLLDMMVILHQAGQVMKKVGKEVREAERDSQVDSLMDAAQKIRDAAMMAFAAGLASGIATMGSGIMGLVGSGAALKKTAEAGKIVANPKGEITAMGFDPKTGYTTKANLSPTQQSQIQALNSRADALRGMWQAGGQTLSGAGEMISAGLQYASKKEEAMRAELEAQATEHQYKAQNADEIVQNMRDFIKEVRQVLGEILQAQSQIESKVWS